MKTDYFKDLTELLRNIVVTENHGSPIPFDKAIRKIVKLITLRNKKGNKIMIIGNGGSASIASHITVDFIKNAEIKAMTFNDSSLITCLSNDIGYEHVFKKPIEIFSKKGDILFSISSSGRSKNILSATKKAKDAGCFIITLSGFDKGNLLREMGNINFYVPSAVYGHVEIVHLAICHLIADTISNCKQHRC